MIHFSKVRFRNLLSYGNYWTEVDLDSHKMTAITAKNGNGKSALVMDSVVYALFGKPYRKINKPGLINSINEKGLEVEIYFSITESSKSNQYIVRRGMKPNIFEIHINGKKLDERDNARDQQKFLEENILKTNYRTFIQIVILGSANYVPFMHLTTSQRREFIENLLDIDIFSTMNSVLKMRNDILKNLRERTKSKQDNVDSLIQKQQKLVSKLSEQRETEQSSIQKEIDLQQQRIDKQKTEIEELNKRISKLEEQKKSLEDQNLESQKKKYSYEMHELSATIKRLETDMKFMQTHENCPTCKQEIDDSHKQNFIEEAKSEAEQHRKDYEPLQENFNETLNALSQLQEIKQEYFEYMTKVENARNNIENIQKDIERLQDRKKNVSNDDIEAEKKQLKEYQSNKEKYEEQMEFLREKEELYRTAFDLLKDNGIKSRIISQYVPIINKLINQYLAEMNFTVTFTLDETFNEQILSRYRDSFTYDNFSQGEKMRIDIALLMVWRNIAEMKNSIHTNILLMDEVFDSSLDGDGMEDFLKILDGVTKNNNIFIISHKINALGEDKFDRVLKIEKVNDFSYLEV